MTFVHSTPSALTRLSRNSTCDRAEAKRQTARPRSDMRRRISATTAAAAASRVCRRDGQTQILSLPARKLLVAEPEPAEYADASPAFSIAFFVLQGFITDAENAARRQFDSRKHARQVCARVD